MRLISHTSLISALALSGGLSAPLYAAGDLNYPLVDTMQDQSFDLAGEAITCPATGEALYGQDAQYTGTASDYTDSEDRTVTDNVTG
ncbi:hypothetical protein [Celeribacter sp.]|uniref:hypothetical protein n=1 Tax=Celeribacter sp. TaxID=1890673 RepID=UPI003A8C92E3